jgi:hypothetical protein
MSIKATLLPRLLVYRYYFSFRHINLQYSHLLTTQDVGDSISLPALPIPVGHVRLVHATQHVLDYCTQIRTNGPLRSRESGGIADGPRPYPAWIYVQGPARRQSQEMLSLSERNSNK